MSTKGAYLNDARYCVVLLLQKRALTAQLNKLDEYMRGENGSISGNESSTEKIITMEKHQKHLEILVKLI